MMRKQYTVKQFRADFPDDDSCLDQLLALRYGEGPVCGGCNRETKYHRISGRRCYGCQWCGFQVYPTAGTVFEKTRTPLTDWFYAMYLMTATRNGVAAKELERQLGVTYKTAWRMAHQIRKLMAQLDAEKPKSSGHIEIDETYCGGKRKGKRGRGAAGKTIVMSMLERDGDIKTKVIPDVKRNTLQPIIQEHVEEG